MSGRIHCRGRSAFHQPMPPHRRQHMHGPIQPMIPTRRRLLLGDFLCLLVALLAMSVIVVPGALWLVHGAPQRASGPVSP
jgi:hypothetical protein